jgi:hypothetical protein
VAGRGRRQWLAFDTLVACTWSSYSSLSTQSLALTNWSQSQNLPNCLLHGYQPPGNQSPFLIPQGQLPLLLTLLAGLCLTLPASHQPLVGVSLFFLTAHRFKCKLITEASKALQTEPLPAPSFLFHDSVLQVLSPSHTLTILSTSAFAHARISPWNLFPLLVKLPSIIQVHDTLSWKFGLLLGVVVYVCNPSTWGG